MDLDAIFNRFERSNVGVEGIVPVLKLAHVVDQISYNRLQIGDRVETQNILCFLDAHLVISKVLNVFDIEVDLIAQSLLHRRFHLIANLSNCVVARGYVENSGNLVIGFDGADVSGRSILNAEDGPPDRRIVNCDSALFYGVSEHRVDDQIKSHPRAVPGNRSFAQGNDGKIVVRQLHGGLFSLQLRDAIWIAGTNRSGLVVKLVFRIPVYGAGTRIYVPFYFRFLGRVREVGRSRGVEHKVHAGRIFGHRIVGQTREKNHLIIGLKIFLRELKNVFVQDTDLPWQVIAEPEQIYDIDFVPTVEQFGDQGGAYVTSATGDKEFHTASIKS